MSSRDCAVPGIDPAGELRVLVVDPAADADAVAELAALSAIGLSPTVNLRRVRDQRVRSEIASRWPCIDMDGRAATVDLPAPSLSSSTVGLVGSGRIARRVAELAVAFGARVQVTGSSRFDAAAAAGWPGERVESLADLVSSSDVVSLHIPATAETRFLIDAPLLARFNPGSVLVNTSRGSVVDENALDQALRDPDAPIRAAALDVHHHEGPGVRLATGQRTLVATIDTFLSSTRRNRSQ